MGNKINDSQLKQVEKQIQKYSVDSYIKYAADELNEGEKFHKEVITFRKKLDKSLKKLKLPLFIGTFTKTQQDILAIEILLAKLPVSFYSSLNKNKNLLKNLITENPQGITEHDAGKIIYLLSLVYGGYPELHKAIKNAPSLAPVGFNKNASANSLRAKAYRYHKKPLKNLKNT
jgi:hypothetical protein